MSENDDGPLVPISLRIEPRLARLVAERARAERRSISNFLALIIAEACAREAT